MPFVYRRRVQFAETDLAGLVHFTQFFRYMEEAEHALWRAAGMSIARFGETAGWPRLSAECQFKAPLRFEDEFDVAVDVPEGFAIAHVPPALTVNHRCFSVSRSARSSDRQAKVRLTMARTCQEVAVPEYEAFRTAAGGALKALDEEIAFRRIAPP